MSKELHGFSDASERAYAGTVYIGAVDSTKVMHMSLIMAKTKVEPIKRLTIPRLELNGALIAARLLHHCRDILGIPLRSTFGWTDSTLVLTWLCADPSRFNGGMFRVFQSGRSSIKRFVFPKVDSL